MVWGSLNDVRDGEWRCSVLCGCGSEVSGVLLAWFNTLGADEVRLLGVESNREEDNPKVLRDFGVGLSSSG